MAPWKGILRPPMRCGDEETVSIPQCPNQTTIATNWTPARRRVPAAARQELMRPGMGKVFKQITDSWGEKAAPDQNRVQTKPRKGSNMPR